MVEEHETFTALVVSIWIFDVIVVIFELVCNNNFVFCVASK